MSRTIDYGLSNSSLSALFRRAVLRLHGYRCRHCGFGGALEVHHCVHRGGHSLLLWEPRNGVPVHAGECHEAVNLLGVGAARPEDQTYLLNMATVTKKQYLLDHGLSENEWRQEVRANLEAVLHE